MIVVVKTCWGWRPRSRPLYFRPVTQSGTEARLDRRVAPVRQAVTLRLDPERPDYTGSVRIELRVTGPVRSLRLHAQELALASAEIAGPAGRLGLAWEAAGDGQQVELTAEREIPPGSHLLAITFTNRFNPEKSGLFRVEHEGRPYLFTQFEELYARTAFPCWDEPGFKIPFQLTLEVPRGCEALSNTPVASETEADGWRTLAFRETPPLPTYLIALAVGDLESAPVPGLTVPGRVVTPRGQLHLAGLAAALLPPVLAALEAYFGSPYPYEKLDLVAVPEFWWGAMEHPGAVTCRDSVLLVDPRAPGPEQRRLLVRVLTHELAHMWFGNLVTIEWWDELWLKESFADWVADKIADQVFPGLGVGLVELEAIQEIMNVDARRATKAIRKPVASDVDILEDNELVYLKGKAVLGMLEQWLGPATFRDGVRGYLAVHAGSTARSTDLWSALAGASGRDVEPVLRTYLDQPGLALVSVEDVEETADGLEISQRRLLGAGEPPGDERWELPIGLKLAGGGGVEERTVLLREERVKIGLKERPDWLHPDRGARGYYRWRLPMDRLLDLAAHAPERLDARERIGFLGNAAALLRAGEIGGGDYLRLLGSFADDPEAQVVSALLNGLREIGQIFVSGDLAEPFAAFVRRTLAPVAARIGWRRGDADAESMIRLRGGLLAALGMEGRDAGARCLAAELAAAYLEDEAKVDPALARSALTVAAAGGDGETFEAFRRGFEATAMPASREHYLVALGSFPRPELQARGLDYALSGPTRPTDLFFVAKGLRETAAGRAALQTWVLEHFHDVLGRIPRNYGACILIPLLATGGSLERLEAARAFFDRPENQVEGWREELAKAAEEVETRAALRRREGAAVAAWLHEAARS